MSIRNKLSGSHRTKNKNYLSQFNKCVYCKKILVGEERTTDHVLPLILGGHRTSIDNVVLSCEKCNNSKGNLLLLEYLFNTIISKSIYISRRKLSNKPILMGPEKE
jgi:5-methylcytosine-specific restriction endonuclease McrA